MSNVSLILDSSLKLLPHCSRKLFFWLILIISVITLIGNIFAIGSIIKRKQKCLQKFCIISLALADIFSVAMFATNNLDTLSRELKVWKLGEFMCHFVPMGQVLGTTASSIALLIIALDRYQNVSVAIITKRWSPNFGVCIAIAFMCLVLCSVTSYPMYLYFTYNPIQVVHTDKAEPVFEDAYLCAAIDKDKLKLYYIIMALLIFLPIAVVFIWFYYQIAVLVWRHRKPFAWKYKLDQCDASNSYTSTHKLFTKKTKTVQVQRKIRTFKVIIVLMVAFIICRLPYWIFFVVKLVETIKGSTMWYIHFSLISLNMFSCALNPFLYTFLNQGIYAARKCHDFLCNVALYCCCFNSKDFEEFSKSSPFTIDYEAKKYNLESKKNVSNSRIKFIDVAHLPMYASKPSA